MRRKLPQLMSVIPTNASVLSNTQHPQQLPQALPTGSAGPPTAAAPSAPRPFRHLTPSEQQERRRYGLCYNYDEPSIYGHQCKHVFYLDARDFPDDTDTPVELEAEDEVITDATTNALVVSLYALARIRTANSMVVLVLIKGERFLTQLDTDSTVNFFRGDTMQRLGLEPSGGDQLRVIVANDNWLQCAGIACNVPIVIGGAAFSVTCVGIDLGGFDFILGIDFLRTIGPILWDLEAMTVSFWQGKRSVVPQPHATALSASTQQPMLDVLLEQ
ncbi:hypothetical protein GUJ93_ZPchr0013g36427 [Zizania palustris]|uniref:Uncharacterized protein n=1 Tax=Zizania palustris TaxID=103762 RepID=A0A8J5X3G4_ZIZPA|nr:hypothetical protein GUJ93_ZPchr0013g36427 [Zizania palustris]